MKKIEKAMDTVEAVVCSTGLTLTIVAVIVNIILDVFFQKANSAFEEIASIGYIWVTYASVGYLYRKRDLMEVSFAVDKLPRIPRYFLDILREIIIIAFGVFMLYFAVKLCEGGFIKKFVSSRIPYFFVDIALVLGFFSQTLSCLKDLAIDLVNIKNVFKGTYPPQEENVPGIGAEEAS